LQKERERGEVVDKGRGVEGESEKERNKEQRV